MDPVESIDILLVEDNPQDVELTIWALKKRNLANRVYVVVDGAEAMSNPGFYWLLINQLYE